MKYTLEQRLDIGRRIYEGELTRFQAAEEYGINDNTARNYMWLYRDTNHRSALSSQFIPSDELYRFSYKHRNQYHAP